MQSNFNYEILNPDPILVEDLAKTLNIAPILARILINRGITKPEEAHFFLNGTIDDFHDESLIGGMDAAVDIILKHLADKNTILIHGDYDADGVTSTAIMVKALTRIGGIIKYYIPDRFDEGYGFSGDAVDHALKEGVRLIVTVDCGSSSIDSIKKAKDAGIAVVITDHHEVPHEFPPADAFVNLKKLGETYPFKELSGAGVALKLVKAIFKKLGRDDWVDFLDLAAIGTVADVVPLIGENRLIVKQGIRLLAKRKLPGIAELLKIGGVQREVLSPWDISFIIAPKINAAGRLADAKIALKFLMEEDGDRARELAQKLVEMNEERQRIENVIKKEIEDKINASPEMLSEPVWVLGSRGWHQGVIGIVASRFSQVFSRPVYLISIDESGTGRGSARCDDNYSVYEALERASKLLIHYGGHRLAGGFSIPEENIEKFRQIVNDPSLFRKMTHPVRVDLELDPALVNLELARSLEKLAPFGEGNPKPLFLTRNIRIQSVMQVGAQNQHLKVWISLEGSDIKGIAFGMGDKINDIKNTDFYYDLLYNLDVDVWNSVEEPSLKIQEIICPDEESFRIISGIDDLAVRTCKKDKDLWNVVDARKVINRRKYIKMLSKNSKKILIFTRNKKQMDVLAANLLQEGITCRTNENEYVGILPESGILITYYDKAELQSDFSEIILYHPPFSWEHFNRDVFRSPSLRRVHLLFGDIDITREEANQEILAPERIRLLKMFSCLKKLGSNSNWTTVDLNALTEMVKDEYIQPVSFRIALRIFREINILDYTEEESTIKYILKENGKRELESSTTYKKQMRKKELFEGMKKMYVQPVITELKEAISSLYRKELSGG